MHFADLSEDEQKILRPKMEKTLEAIILGMDLERAMLAAGCRKQEMTILEQDEDFQFRVSFASASSELENLELHKLARKNAAEYGKAEPTQWFLGKTNSGRFGDGKNAIYEKNDVVFVNVPDFAK